MIGPYHLSLTQDDTESLLGRVLLAVSFLLVLVVIVLWRYERGKSFPLFSPGAYLGVLNEEGRNPRPIAMVVRQPGKMTFAVADASLAGQSVDTIPRPSSLFAQQSVFPIAVTLDNRRLIFAGQSDGQGYSGVVNNEAGEQIGRWTMRAATGYVPQASSNRLLSAFRQHQRVLSDRRALALKGRELDAEIGRLQGLIVDPAVLQKTAETKLMEDRAHLELASRTRAQLERDVAGLRRQIEVAERLLPLGRLRALSRETLRKEQPLFEHEVGL